QRLPADGAARLQVIHGLKVEAHDTWFGECVSDDPLAEAGFDRTEVVFGSGGRLRSREAVFVSPPSTVDCLHILETDGHAFVSNSLVALLSVTGAEIAPLYPRYYHDLN